MLEVCTSSEMLQKKEKNPICIVAPPTSLSFSPPLLLFTLLNYLLAFLSSAGGQAPGICQCVFVCVCFFVYAEMNTALHTNRGGHSHPSQVLLSFRDVCLYHMLVRELTSHGLTGNRLSWPQGEHTEEMVLTRYIFTLLKYLLDNILGDFFIIIWPSTVNHWP